MDTPLTPSLPAPSRQENSLETQNWRRSLLDVFTHVYKCIYNDTNYILDKITDLPEYADNAAAIAGGLAVGDFYRTGADPDPVCVVH